MPDFHSLEFTPWTNDGDRIVLPEWPASFPDGAIVRIGCDVFAECDGPVYGFANDAHRNYGRLRTNRTGDYSTWMGMESRLYATLADLRRDLFLLIDRHSRVWWLIETETPDVGPKWIPPAGSKAHWPPWEGGALRPNIALAVQVRNQSDADRLLPELIRCRDLCGRLCVYFTGEGRVDFIPYMGGRSYRCPCGFHRTENELVFMGGDVYLCPECSKTCEIGGTIDTIIICGHESPDTCPVCKGKTGRYGVAGFAPCRECRGIGTIPCNPTDLDAVRDTVRQCDESGVGCWIESLGGTCVRSTRHGKREMKLSLGGSDLSEWPADVRAVNERFQPWGGVNV